jgi:hypothetical protein
MGRLVRMISPHYPEASSCMIQQYKLQTLHALILLSIVVISLMGIVRFTQHNYLQACLDFIYVIIAIFSFLSLRRSSKYYTVLSRVLLGMALLPSILVLGTVPESQSRLLWLGPLIMMAFFLRGRQEGMVWTVAVIAVLTMFYVADPMLLNLEGVDFLIFIANLIVISIAMLWYEWVREQSEETLNRIQTECERHSEKKAETEGA